jgi:hypothetical protein
MRKLAQNHKQKSARPVNRRRLLEALPAYADTTPRPVLDRRTLLTSPPAATAPRPTIAAFRPLSSPHRPALHLA